MPIPASAYYWGSHAPPVSRLNLFATAHPGFEPVLARELEALGQGPLCIEPGGVGFEADHGGLLWANLQLRTAGRILVRVAEFRARTFPELERHANKIDWAPYLASGVGIHLRVTSKKSRLYHERGIGERLAKTLVGDFPEAVIVPSRSDTDAEEHSVVDLPTVQRFVVRFHRDLCTVSADSSGPLLHRRGYRLEIGKAPLRETFAAAVLLATNWDPAMPLVDPFCGSGTIPIEAAMIARRIAPGLARRFSLERWSSFPPPDVDVARAKARAQIRAAAETPILGADRDAGVILAAGRNAIRAGVGADVEWRSQAISALELPARFGWIVTNPPYGTRVGERVALRNLYAQLGKVLRDRAVGWHVGMLSPDPMLEGQTKLDWSPVAEGENGGIAIRLLTTQVAV